MRGRSTSRRHLLAATALVACSLPAAQARTIRGALPWSAGEAYPPPRLSAAGWLFFTEAEAAAVTAMANRLIPPDELGAGGAEAGCATFIDRQLAGSFGTSDWLYMQGPFPAGTPQQGLQEEHPPNRRYREALAAIAAHCREKMGGRLFHTLSSQEQDALLTAMEAGTSGIAGLRDKSFFELLLQNVMEGYFADPAYGGNREMVGWKLVGFPGARYDFREMLDRLDQPYTDPPVGLFGRPAWTRAAQ
ncbi:gluconate 2-dehydrogenase subunit 3 family protein [Roseococcus pinisoli]|uniref:Gluconate 2-dehydrogenase subunit 3 family protein n=1 Tax=Roseococcus pinisoli TaxID=2835040 RepID=A0ABS5QB03_9PROT|nr:gluconate 2-dehydrogenase subunit 3 family protein [Roseococcus pinisoli]MBS7810125.1 gluconate 2-dehydrogenase subunit 3 family protein [Roseococcus pinisoli]